MQVMASARVQLDADTLDRIFNNRLEELNEGLWPLEKSSSGRAAGIYRTLDMQGHGSDVDELVSPDLNDPKYVVQMTACRLIRLLRKHTP